MPQIEQDQGRSNPSSRAEKTATTLRPDEGRRDPPPAPLVISQRRPRRRLPARVATLLCLLLGAALVELMARLELVDSLTLIPFTRMVAGGIELLQDGEYVSEAMVPTMLAILLSFILASVLGIAVGCLLWRVKVLETALDPYITAYYAIPTFALYPVLVAITGTGLVPIVTVAVLFAMVAVIVQTAAGLKGVPPINYKLASSLRLGALARFRYIALPAALPAVFAGLRLALVYSTVSVVATEFILSPTGMGHYISLAYNSFDLERMYGSILLVLCISLFFSYGMSYLGKRLLRGFNA